MEKYCVPVWRKKLARLWCGLTFSWWMMSIRLLRGSLKWIWILTGNSPQPRRVKWKGGSLRTDTFKKPYVTSLKYKSGGKKSIEDALQWVSKKKKKKKRNSKPPTWILTQTQLKISKNQWFESLSSSPPLKLKFFFLPMQQTLIWRPVFSRACVRRCILCVYSRIPSEWRICFSSLPVIPSSTFRLCVESSESTGPEWGSLGMKTSVGEGGAYERLLRQRERLVSWNSQEATAKDCWLMKEIIYSEAMGKLKSFCCF